MKENLEAKVSLSSVQCNNIPNYISIEVEDANSGLRIIELCMSYEALGKIITGHGAIPVIAKYVNTLDNIGKRLEVKIEMVQGIDSRVNKEEFKEMFKKAVKPYEVDGWKADAEDSFNFHKHTPKGYYAVTFRRYIGG